MQRQIITTLINELRKDLPPAFGRKHICGRLPGWLSVGGLANADAARQGPPRVRCGKTCLYERESFLKWFENRLMTATPELAEEVENA